MPRETDTFVRLLDRLARLTDLEAVEEAEAGGFTPYVTFLKREPTREVEEALVRGIALEPAATPSQSTRAVPIPTATPSA